MTLLKDIIGYPDDQIGKATSNIQLTVWSGTK